MVVTTFFIIPSYFW